MEDTLLKRYIYLDLDLNRGHKVWTFLIGGILKDSEIVYRSNSLMRKKNIFGYLRLFVNSFEGYIRWVYLVSCSKSTDYVYVRNDIVAGLVCVLLNRRYIFVYSHPKYAFNRDYLGSILGRCEKYLVRKSVYVLPITKRLLYDIGAPRLSHSEMPIPLGIWKGNGEGVGLVYIGSIASNRGLEDLMLTLCLRLNETIDLYSHSANFSVTGVIHRGSYSKDNETAVLKQYRFGVFVLDRIVQFYSSSPIKIKDYIEHGLTVISVRGIVKEVDMLIDAGIILDYTSKDFLETFNRLSRMSYLEYKEYSLTNYTKASHILCSFDEIAALFAEIEKTG